MSQRQSVNLRPAYLEAAKELSRNKEQWEAYQSTGHCVLQAGPGSGKTKVLTVKFARMLHEDTSAPRGLACVTYNNECARELIRKLDQLGVRPSHNVFVGTVHSFCLKNIIRPYGLLSSLGIPDPIKIVSNQQKSKIFGDAVTKTISVNERPSDWTVRCDRYRRTFLDRTSADWLNRDEEAAKVIEAYEQRLRAANLIDFDDMVLLGLRLVQSHEWLRRSLIARFPIFVVDEYQDLGVPLHHLVRRLCFSPSTDNARLFAVGDPDQSIYGFTGAYPELLQKLAKRSDVQPVHLRLNYRSREQIVQASELALGETRNYKSANQDVGVVEFHHCPAGRDEQANKIVSELIPRTLKDGTARCLGEFAILYSTKYEGDGIAGALSTAGISFIRIDGNAPYPKTPLTRWLEDCAAWCSGGWRLGDPKLSEILDRWQSFFDIDRSHREVVKQSQTIVEYLLNNRDPDAGFGKWLADFYTKCLGQPLSADPNLQDERETIESIKTKALSDGELSKWSVARFGGQGGSPSHVNLMTLHSAKGLEFDVVFMYCMDQGVIPSYRQNSVAAKKEARRLFYVGLSRTRHEVHLTYSGWRTTPWGAKVQDGPSEFLIELEKRLAELQAGA